jgi:hypothetical protein
MTSSSRRWTAVYLGRAICRQIDRQPTAKELTGQSPAVFEAVGEAVGMAVGEPVGGLDRVVGYRVGAEVDGGFDG